MKKLLSAIIVIVVIIIGTLFLKPKNTVEQSGKPVVTIGINLPLTGSMSFAGEYMQKSLEMAMEDLKDRDLKFEYKLIIEDNVFDNKKTVLNLNRFNNINNVNAVMSLWGSAGTLTSEFAEKNKLIHMSCASSNVVGKGFYNFNHATTHKEHISTIIKYYKKNGYKKVGLIYDMSLEVEEFMDSFRPALKEDGFEIAFDIPVVPGTMDLRTEIIKMKSQTPDVIYSQMVPPQLIVFGKQRKELGLNTPLTSMNVFSFAPEYFENETFFTEDSGNSQWMERYSKYSGLSPMPCTVNMYDGLMMIVDGFEKTNPNANEIPSNEDVVKTMLNNKTFKSVLDRIEIDSDGNINSPAVVKRIKNGKPETI